MNPSVIRAELWSIDVTACTVARIEVEETGVTSGDTDEGAIGDRRYGYGVSVKQGHKRESENVRDS